MHQYFSTPIQVDPATLVGPAVVQLAEIDGEKERDGQVTLKYQPMALGKLRGYHSTVLPSVCSVSGPIMKDNACARGASPILRNPHHNYYRHRRTLEPAFIDISSIWNSKTRKLRVSQIAKLPKSILYDWKSVRTKGSSWRLWLEDAHGCLHRIFSGEKEPRGEGNDVIHGNSQANKSQINH
jgi:hypothetical protein